MMESSRPTAVLDETEFHVFFCKCTEYLSIDFQNIKALFNHIDHHCGWEIMSFPLIQRARVLFPVTSICCFKFFQGFPKL